MGQTQVMCFLLIETEHRVASVLLPNPQETTDMALFRNTVQRKWSVLFRNVKLMINNERPRNYS